MKKATILNDKLVGNHLPPNFFPRHSLMKLYEKAQTKRLLFISAPSGFGKTTTTTQWVTQSKSQPLWISLDQYDNSLPLFYMLCCRALLSFQKENNELAKIVLSANFLANPVEYTMFALAALKPLEKPYTLILDNFQTILNPEILATLPYVFQRFNLTTKIIILSRTDMPKEFLKGFDRENIAYISTEDLAFTPAEILRYYQANQKTLTLPEAQRVFNETRGWPLIVPFLATFPQLNLAMGQIEGELHHYLERYLWELLPPEIQLFLLKICIIDELTLDICHCLTEDEHAEDHLSKLAQESILLTTHTADSYYFYGLFQAFLLHKLKSRTDIPVNDLYIKASQYYLTKGDIFKAQRVAIKSGDHELIISSFLQAKGYSPYETPLEERGKAVLKFQVDNLPPAIFQRAPFLHIIPTWYYYLTGHGENMLKHLDCLKEHLTAIVTDHPQVTAEIVHLFKLDPRLSLLTKVKGEPIWQDVSREIHRRASQQTITRTLKLPFLHRSLLDYYEINDSHILTQMLTFLPKIYHKLPREALVAIHAGLALEQDDLQTATQETYTAYSLLNENSLEDIRFSVYMQMLHLHFIQRDMTQFHSEKKRLLSWLNTASTATLTPNFLAYTFRVSIWQGDRQQATQWLDHPFVNAAETIQLAHFFQYFTTIRAYILLNKNHEALILAEKIRIQADEFKRLIDEAEASVLMAIIYWRLGHSKKAIDLLEHIILKSQPYHLIRVFADEGGALLPILKIIKNRTNQRKSHAREISDYFNDLYTATLKTAKEQAGIVPALTLTEVKLSKQQLRMIQLLGQGHKFSKIVTLTGLSIHTIRAHVTLAYRKLGVNNRADAVAKAKDLHIL